MVPHIASRPVATKDAPLGALRLLSITDFTTSPRELSNFLNEILKLSGTNDGKAKMRSHPRMPQLLDFLISHAEKWNKKKTRKSKEKYENMRFFSIEKNLKKRFFN